MRTSTKTSRSATSTPRDSGSDSFEDEPRETKRRKTNNAKQSSVSLHATILAGSRDAKAASNCAFPGRAHSAVYHRPLLISDSIGRSGRQSLLSWFESVNEKRGMPWRKPWLGPMPDVDTTDHRSAYAKRAYEVWISEIMLQQTRVAVVIDYWNKWMAKWPTIQDLAAADADDVLAAWRGLGYYSRATRIHEAAKLVVQDSEMDGLLPSSAKELETKIPGIGRYTAGAICSIVFGVPEPMVDGNVLRVLSRQMGVLSDVKTTKSTIDLLWAAADALVKTVAKDCQAEDHEDGADLARTDGPGKWGQALMELGSTVCTPKPNCGECPISSTCKAFAEGKELAEGDSSKSLAFKDLVDIEDMCTICDPFDDPTSIAESETAPPSQKTKIQDKPKSAGQAKLTAFAFTKASDKAKQVKETIPSNKLSGAVLEKAIDHAKLFPTKVVKKAVRQEETIVCALRTTDGRYLIERRPEKGLLANLYEFPSRPITEDDDASPKSRKQLAKSHTEQLLASYGLGEKSLSYEGELGSVPWVFSHLKLTMHTHLFTVDAEIGDDAPTVDRQRWTSDVESESMGTGMRKCWALVKAAE